MQDAKGGKLLLGKQMITLLSTQILIRSSNSIGTYNNSAEDNILGTVEKPTQRGSHLLGKHQPLDHAGETNFELDLDDPSSYTTGQC